jgi:hypothetical protein
MAESGCPRCRWVRTILLAAVLGGVAGFAVVYFGGARDLSMLATLVGALLPLMWHTRRNRDRHTGSE